MVALSEFGSDIDDSFDPVPWPSVPEPTRAGAYNGPRESHWSVSSSVGSFIDDRCPTVHGSFVVKSPPGHVKPLAGSLLKKLAKATIEEKRAITKVSEIEHVHDEHVTHNTPRDEEPAKKEQPKRFYLPPLPNPKRGIKVRDQARGDIVIKPAQPKQTAPRPKAPTARPPSLTLSLKPPSVATNPSLRKTKVVRIVGRNGEEAFVELPNMLPSYTPATNAVGDAAFPVTKSAMTSTEEHVPRKHVKPKPEREGDPKATGAKAPAVKTEQSKQTEQTAKARAKTKGSEQSVKMSGALPDLVRKTSTAKSTASCTKDSGVFMSGVFDNVSSAPSATSDKVLDIASRIAKTASLYSRSEPVKSASGSSVQSDWQQGGQFQTTWSAVAKSEGKQSVMSNYKPPSVHSAKSPSTFIHNFDGMTAFEAPGDNQSSAQKSNRSPSAVRQPRSTSTGPSGTSGRSQTRSPVKPSSLHRESTRHAASVIAFGAASGSPAREESHRPAHAEKTVFAGTGWISPHPLSVAPSEIASPPQSEIRLPTGSSGWHEGPFMTYDEWQQVKRSSGTTPVHSSRRGASHPHITRDGVNGASFDRLGSRSASQVPAPDHWVGSRQPSAGSYHQSHEAISDRSHVQVSLYQGSQGSPVFSYSMGPSIPHGQYPPQLDGTAPYQVGISQEALIAYQNQLEDTTSNYMSQISHIQRDSQTQPQYATPLSAGQSSSGYVSYSQQSAATFPRPSQLAHQHYRCARPKMTELPNGQIQLKMPWDPSQTGSGSSTAHGTVKEPSHASSKAGSRGSLTTDTPSSESFGSKSPSHFAPLEQVDHRKNRSPPNTQGSESSMPPTQPDSSRPTSHWENIHQAEQGDGGFQETQL